MQEGHHESGIYETIIGDLFETLLCDMEDTSDGGGAWTVIFRNSSNTPIVSESFRNWNQYRYRFGKSWTDEYWLGLKAISILTRNSSKPFQLKVEMEDLYSYKTPIFTRV